MNAGQEVRYLLLESLVLTSTRIGFIFCFLMPCIAIIINSKSFQSLASYSCNFKFLIFIILHRACIAIVRYTYVAIINCIVDHFPLKTFARQGFSLEQCWHALML